MIFWLLLIAVFSAFPVFAVQQPIEEKVVVTANSYPVPFENLSRAVTVITREDIRNLPARSIAEVLAQATSVDMRSRSPFGVQTDLSVRGSAFSQVLVLVDGMRINDSQTGHHNGDFPVQLQDVERIEVLLGDGSSIYGADAFGGVVNIITRRHVEQNQASISGGQNDFLEGYFSAGFSRGIFEQSISGFASSSSGFEYDRDFRNISVSGRTNAGEGTTFYASYVNKEFGANGFYGPAPSKEWTNQTLVSFERKFEAKSGAKGIFQTYYRTHGDRFLYDIRTPDLYENNHRTHAVAATGRFQRKMNDSGMLTIGGEVGGDWISSSNLGDHGYARANIFGEFQWTISQTAVVYPGLRLDYYSNFGASLSPSLSGSWWVHPRIRLRSSAGHAFRVPTFTELYYRDPNNQANSELEPESAWSAEAGADFVPARNWMASLTLFSRWEEDVIDWIRSSTAEKWHTANIRDLQTVGIEIGLERSLGSRGRVATRYSRFSIDAGDVDYISKYVLDYARDTWSTSVSLPLPLSFAYQQTLLYKRRADGRDYWILDGRVERHFRKFTASVDFTNLLNSAYQEIKGVNMPGRWFVMTLRTR